MFRVASRLLDLQKRERERKGERGGGREREREMGTWMAIIWAEIRSGMYPLEVVQLISFNYFSYCLSMPG